MPSVLRVRDNQRLGLRGGLHRPCVKCGKLFLKTGRWCTQCPECVRSRHLKGIKERVLPDNLSPHCCKCNKLLKTSDGYMSSVHRSRKDTSSGPLSQKTTHNFCFLCWDKIVKDLKVQPNGPSHRKINRFHALEK